MQSNRRLLTLLLALFCLCLFAAPTTAQGPAPDPRFGVVETYLNGQGATATGAGYTRIILRWDVIQPHGRDDWKPANVPDPFIEADLQAGREVVAVLIGTPDWASRGVNSAKAVPDMEAWGSFTKRIAQQYQGRIKHWIIWNEPDVWDQNHPGSTWLGTEADYYELLKVAYNNIKEVDPTMQVHLTGLTYHWDFKYDREQYLSRLLRVITADPDAVNHNYYFDAVVYHLYYDPRQIYRIMGEIRAIMNSYGVGNKPIWINETNAPPTDDPLEPPHGEPLLVVSTDEQTAFVLQGFALMLAAGAERIEFYKMRNSTAHPEDIEPFGLLRGDDSRRPVFDTYRVVTQHYAGFRRATLSVQGDIYLVTLDRGDKTTRVVWTTATEARAVTLNAIAPEALVVDDKANEQVVAASDGAYTLTLPGATCSAGWCFIDGAPRVLVENGAPGEQIVQSTEVETTPTTTPPGDEPTATFTPTPVITATATATATIEPSPSPSPSPTSLPTSTPIILPTATATRQAATPVAAVLESTTTPTVAPTATSTGIATPTSAASAPPSSEPESLSPDFASIFTPNRILFLVVIGVLLFTFFYFIQFRLWTNRRG